MAVLFIDLLLIQLRVILLLSRTPSSLSATVVVFYSRCWRRSMFLALPIETKGISFCTF